MRDELRLSHALIWYTLPSIQRAEREVTVSKDDFLSLKRKERMETEDQNSMFVDSSGSFVAKGIMDFLPESLCETSFGYKGLLSSFYPVFQYCMLCSNANRSNVECLFARTRP